MLAVVQKNECKKDNSILCGSRGNNLIINWGDGNNSAKMKQGQVVTNCFSHTYRRPGHYNVKVINSSAGPLDESIVNWFDVTTVVVDSE